MHAMCAPLLPASAAIILVYLYIYIYIRISIAATHGWLGLTRAERRRASQHVVRTCRRASKSSGQPSEQPSQQVMYRCTRIYMYLAMRIKTVRGHVLLLLQCILLEFCSSVLPHASFRVARCGASPLCGCWRPADCNAFIY